MQMRRGEVGGWGVGGGRRGRGRQYRKLNNILFTLTLAPRQIKRARRETRSLKFRVSGERKAADRRHPSLLDGMTLDFS